MAGTANSCSRSRRVAASLPPVVITPRAHHHALRVSRRRACADEPKILTGSVWSRTSIGRLVATNRYGSNCVDGATSTRVSEEF